MTETRIKDLLTSAQQSLDNNDPKIIKNKDLFNITTTPTIIYERVSTKEKIYDFFINCAKSILVNKVYIIGKPGTGKTVTVQYYTKELSKLQNYSDKLRIFYISGKTEQSSYQVFKSLVDQLQLPPKITGYSKRATSDLFLKCLDKNCLIILDEIDKIKDADALLYLLTRVGQIKQNFKHIINLMVISNDPHWYHNKLDKSTQGSFGQKTILFQDYNIQEIYSILKIRAREGLYPNTIAEGTLAHIAKKVVENNQSDSRIAIEVLGASAEYTQKNNQNEISIQQVDEVYNQSVMQVHINCLQLLDPKSLEVLYICNEFKPQGGGQKSARGIYQAYIKFCKDQDKKPSSYSTFRTILENLEAYKLIKQFQQKFKETHQTIVELIIESNLISNFTLMEKA